jgi:hypothetical protein
VARIALPIIGNAETARHRRTSENPGSTSDQDG